LFYNRSIYLFETTLYKNVCSRFIVFLNEATQTSVILLSYPVGS